MNRPGILGGSASTARGGSLNGMARLHLQAGHWFSGDRASGGIAAACPCQVNRPFQPAAQGPPRVAFGVAAHSAPHRHGPPDHPFGGLSVSGLNRHRRTALFHSAFVLGNGGKPLAGPLGCAREPSPAGGVRPPDGRGTRGCRPPRVRRSAPRPFTDWGEHGSRPPWRSRRARSPRRAPSRDLRRVPPRVLRRA